MKRFAPLTLIATAALVLTGCSGDDGPTEEGVAMATDHYNTVANETYGPELDTAQFEKLAKLSCAQLSDEPTSAEFDEVIENLKSEHRNMHHNAAVSLVLQGSNQFCPDKFEHAHGD